MYAKRKSVIMVQQPVICITIWKRGMFNFVLSNYQSIKRMNKGLIETAEEIMELSLKKFRWKISGQIDKLAEIVDERFVFVHHNGDTVMKDEWISELKAKALVYQKVEPQDHMVEVYGNLAILVGKAWFTLGNSIFYRLAYTEVYVNDESKWKLVNLHTTLYN
jgi:hypothetical protein